MEPFLSMFTRLHIVGQQVCLLGFTLLDNRGTTIFEATTFCAINQQNTCSIDFSPLNEHRFKHNFYCLSPIYICGTGKEDNEHYLLHCPQFTAQRQDLLGQVLDVGYDVASMNSKDLYHLL